MSRIALWGAFDTADGELLASRRVIEEELRRRLPGGEVTALSPSGAPVAADGGRSAEAPPPAGEMSGRFDCIVATGAAVPELDPGAVPVLAAGDGDGPLPPAALLLPGRLDPGLLRRRAELLRLLGWAWPAGRVLSVQGDASLLEEVDAIAAALLPLVESGSVAVQLAAPGSTRGEEEFAAALEAGLGGRCRRVPEVAAVEDLVALVGAATAHAGPPGLGLWAAVALGVPCVAPATAAGGRHDALLAGLGVRRPAPAELGGALAAALAGEVGPPRAQAAIEALERHLDGLARRVLEATEGRERPPAPPSTDAGRLTDADRWEELRQAHEARGHRLFAERRAARAAQEAAHADLTAALAVTRAEAERLRSELDAARAANDRITGSRTWRYTRPVRETVARVRERRR